MFALNKAQLEPSLLYAAFSNLVFTDLPATLQNCYIVCIQFSPNPESFPPAHHRPAKWKVLWPWTPLLFL